LNLSIFFFRLWKCVVGCHAVSQTLMKASTRYFATLGVNIHKSQLELLFQSDVPDMPALCALILKDALPKMFRARAWLHMLLGWKAFSSFSFLSLQLQAKFADLQRVTLLLGEEERAKKKKKSKKTERERATEMLDMLKVQQRMRFERRAFGSFLFLFSFCWSATKSLWKQVAKSSLLCWQCFKQCSPMMMLWPSTAFRSGCFTAKQRSTRCATKRWSCWERRM
jgi:hypothetical protein